MEEEEQVPWGRSALRFLAWVAVILLGLSVLLAINDLMTEQLLYGDGKGGAYIQLAEIVAFVLALLGLLHLYGYVKSEHWVVPLIVLGIFVAFEIYDITQDANALDDGVYDYCAYGAANDDELFTCLNETTPGVIRYSDSPAGQFARDEKGCRAGAGPYCAEAEANQEAQEDYEQFKEEGY